MAEVCDSRHDDIADAITGELSVERQAELDGHAAGCAGCAEGLRELQAVASFLGEVGLNDDLSADRDAVAWRAEPPAELADRIADAIDRAGAEPARDIALAPRRRHLRRGRAVGLAIAVAAAAAAVIILGAGAIGGGSHTPSGELVALHAKGAVAGASATAELSPEGYGTAIDLTVTGLDAGKVYALWLADGSGARIPAGTFVASAGGKASLDTISALRRDHAVKIWITDPEDTTVLSAALT